MKFDVTQHGNESCIFAAAAAAAKYCFNSVEKLKRISYTIITLTNEVF
jgi:hypothetical protein